VANKEEPGLGTQTKEEKPVLAFRMLIVKELDGILIMKDSLGLFEGNPMFIKIDN
jgi:hypothetical protein